MNFKCLEGRCGYESGEERGRRAYVLMLYAALSAPPSLIGSVEWAAEDGGLEARGIPLQQAPQVLAAKRGHGDPAMSILAPGSHARRFTI
jgi:hypothetical protein